VRSELATRYLSDGYVCPLPAIGAARAAALRSRLEAFEASAGDTLGRLPGQMRAKSHLLFPWLADLVRDPAVLDAVEAIIGPDILVYHLTCWLKEPGDESFVSWHQDGTYFYLDPAEHVTAWVALSDSNGASGCVQVIPGSHTWGQQSHTAHVDANNLLSNGQTIERELDESQAVSLELLPGQMSLHHTHIVHRSAANTGDDRRLGIGISYIPTRVRYLGDHRVSASLVRGEDRFGHFDPEPRPREALHPDAVAFHAEACARFFGQHGSARSAAMR
jgi:chlorinating enzyme